MVPQGSLMAVRYGCRSKRLRAYSLNYEVEKVNQKCHKL